MSEKIWRLHNASTQRQIVDLDINAARQLYAQLSPQERPHWFAWRAGWMDWLRVTDATDLHVAPDAAPQPRAAPPPPPSFSESAPVAQDESDGEMAQAPQGPATRITGSGVILAAVDEIPAYSLDTEEPAEHGLRLQLEESPAPTPQAGPNGAPSARAPRPRPPTPKPAQKPAPAASAEPYQERRKHQRHGMKLKVIIEIAGRTFRTFSKDVSLSGLQMQAPLPWETSQDTCKIYLASPDGRESIEFQSRIVVDLKNPKRIQFVDANPTYITKLGAWIDAHKRKSSTRAA